MDSVLTPTARMKLAGIAPLFDQAALAEPIKEVDCTLSGGTAARCLSVTIKPEPAQFQIGPWCPRNISDGPEVFGIWLEGGKVHDSDGGFIQTLATFYKDETWQLFGPKTGKINVTDTQVSCEAAARPDVDPAYQNHCVECQVSYMDAGASQTFVIPLNPVMAKTVDGRGQEAAWALPLAG